MRAFAKVPSSVYLADTFLVLDKKLGQKLLVPAADPKADGNPAPPPLSKEVLAGREGARAKKLLGGLRYLFRNSVSSHCPKVSQLKSLLKKKPRAIWIK